MNKYFKHRHKIAHLSSYIQDELVERYYAKGNVKELISSYNIDIKEGSFYLVLPLKRDSEVVCPYCSSEMLFLPPSKSRQFAKEYICNTCWHIEGKYNCECQNCILKKQDEAHNLKLKRALKKSSKNTENEIHLDSSKTVKIEEMTLIDKIYLGALLRTYIPSKNCLITINKQVRSNLAPSIPFKNKIFVRLIENNIIFEISSSEKSATFAINILDIYTNRELFQSIISPKKVQDISEELIQLIRDIQIYEAVEYFSIVARNKFSIGDLYHNLIDEMFYSLFMIILENNYSTGQLHYFIYSSIRNYSAKYACSGIASNPLPEIHDNILRLYNKATTEDWNIKNYNRAYSTQPSELFKIVANELLDIKEALFYKAVCSNLKN